MALPVKHYAKWSAYSSQLKAPSLPNDIQLKDVVSDFARRAQLFSGIEKMIAAGWCYHQVHYLARSMDLAAFEELVSLQQLRRDDHSSCQDRDWCIAHNVNVELYQTRHCNEDCQCEKVSVPYEALISIIEAGKVPLVSIKRKRRLGNKSQLRLKMGHRDGSSQYTAVSHVWADGLGNPCGNSLPTCQLEKLDTLLRHTDHSSFKSRSPQFWFDTLCIPVKEEHQQLRTNCIDDMGSIYAGAHTVLVLDAELMNLSAKNTQDCVARIICSVWMRRSWTLQEGILAQRCAFVFHDDLLVGTPNSITFELKLQKERRGKKRWWNESLAIDGPASNANDTALGLNNDDVESSVRDPNTQQSSCAAGKSLFQYLEHNLVRIKFEAKHVRFMLIWNALAGRSTSQPDDIYLMLANLLGFKTQQIMDLPPDSRLDAFLSNLHALPLSLLFHPKKGPSICLPAVLDRNPLGRDLFMTKIDGSLAFRGDTVKTGPTRPSDRLDGNYRFFDARGLKLKHDGITYDGMLIAQVVYPLPECLVARDRASGVGYTFHIASSDMNYPVDLDSSDQTYLLIEVENSDRSYHISSDLAGHTFRRGLVLYLNNSTAEGKLNVVPQATFACTARVELGLPSEHNQKGITYDATLLTRSAYPLDLDLKYEFPNAPQSNIQEVPTAPVKNVRSCSPLVLGWIMATTVFGPILKVISDKIPSRRTTAVIVGASIWLAILLLSCSYPCWGHCVYVIVKSVKHKRDLSAHRISYLQFFRAKRPARNRNDPSEAA